MNQTSIEWVRNPDGSQGYTWNPITGCLNHDNGLCKGGGFPCYACKLAHGRLKQRYLANIHRIPFVPTMPAENILEPFYPRFWEERLSEPIGYATTEKVDGVLTAKPSKGKGIFVCDMGDLFGIGIPEEWTQKVLRVCEHTSYNRYYLLTKQPQNLIKFNPFPENCWVGVTATNPQMLREALMHLEEIKASVKYVSLEPLLEQIYKPVYFLNALPDFLSVIDWLIIGACTGTLAEMVNLGLRNGIPDKAVKPYGNKYTLQPRIEWVREIVEAADKAGIPVFLKENLKPLLQPLMTAPNMSWFGNAFGLRQELPGGK